MPDAPSRELLDRLRRGDSDAAPEIFDRYVRRLIALARGGISAPLARRIDPEDVVQSAFGSFFAHAQQGEYVWRRAGDLWRLLAAITIHKLRGQVEWHTALRRSIRREQRLPEEREPSSHAAAPADPQPTPAEAAAVAELVENTLQTATPAERRVLELRLAGHTIEHIATEIGRSQRTVRRLLRDFRAKLEHELWPLDGPKGEPP